MNRHLGGIRAGNQVGGAEEVEELLVVEPATALNYLLLHHRNVRRGPPEGDRAEL